VLIGAASFAACVLPDGLEISRDPIEVNQPPRIIQDPPSYDSLRVPFSLVADEKPVIRFAVSDPNPRDIIHIRGFVDYHEGRTGAFLIKQSAPSDDPSLPRLALESDPLSCMGLLLPKEEAGAGGSGMEAGPKVHVITLVVTDRPFDSSNQAPVNRRPSEGALTVEATWVFQCIN
jgi:hypothetical protein